MTIGMTFLSETQVFKNKAEIRDHAELQRFAYGAATFRIQEMREYPVKGESAWRA